VAEPAPDSVYRPTAPPRALAPDPEADAHASTILRDGYVVLREVLSPEELGAMRAALADDGGCRVPRPRPMHGVSAIWALDEFTEENGATQLIPGSHLWSDDSPPPRSEDAVSITMPAGSVVVFAGTLLHRGGASRGGDTRLGVTPQYCQPWDTWTASTRSG